INETAVGVVDLSTIQPAHPVDVTVGFPTNANHPLTSGSTQTSPPTVVDSTTFSQITDFNDGTVQLITDFSARDNDNNYKQNGELDSNDNGILDDPGLLAHLDGQVTVTLQATVNNTTYTFDVVDPSMNLNNTNWALLEGTEPDSTTFGSGLDTLSQAVQ